MKSLFFLVAFLFSSPAFALRNVSVDDTSSLITYTGIWNTTSSSLDFDGSHSYSQDPTATASFTFTGVAIYYVAPQWPYPVNTQLKIDSMSPVTVSLVDPNHVAAPNTAETAAYSVLWSQTGLSNTQHTLVASMASGGQFVVMDGLVYTALDPGDAVPSSSHNPSSSPSPTSSAAATGTKHTSGISLGAIVAAVVGGILAIISAGLIICFMCRQRQRKLLVTGDIDTPAIGEGAQKPITPFVPQDQGFGNNIPPQQPSSIKSQQGYGGNPFPQQQQQQLPGGYAPLQGAGYTDGYQPLPQRIDTPLSSGPSDITPMMSQGAYPQSPYDPYSTIGNAMMLSPNSVDPSFAGAAGSAPYPTMSANVAPIPHPYNNQYQQQQHPGMGFPQGPQQQQQLPTKLFDGQKYPTGYPPAPLPQQYNPQQYQQYPQQQQYQPQVLSPPQPQFQQDQRQHQQGPASGSTATFVPGVGSSAPSEYSSGTPAPSETTAGQKQIGGGTYEVRRHEEDDIVPPPAYTQN